ncbi:MAG: alanine dehydrogenase [bacterium]|nr:alanine dehydrogenase [bacterium]
MIIGVPKELPIFKDIPEYRVGLSPMGVRELIELGTTVYVESGAGSGVGFTDVDYETVGAKIVYSKDEVYKRAEIIVKVREPQELEYKIISEGSHTGRMTCGDEGKVIMGFFNLVAAPKALIDVLINKKTTIIGYEIIQKDDGKLPVLIPMSEIAGKLAPQIAGRLLESSSGGRGILLGGIPGVPPAEVVIFGGGTLGCNAAKSLAGLGANVYVMDISRDKLEDIACHMEHKVTTLFATKYNIEKLVKFANVLIGAVFVVGERTPILVSKDMVKSMKKGAVIIDFDIDQGGCVETAKLAPAGKFVYTVEGVIHFCMPNTPTLVARTSTHALTGAILPYLKNIVKFGIDKALKEDSALNRGVYIYKGSIKKEYIK